MLKLIVGLMQPTSGTVRTEAPDGIAYAFQKSPLFPWLSLYENVRLCMGADNRAEAERDALKSQVGNLQQRVKDLSEGKNKPTEAQS